MWIWMLWAACTVQDLECDVSCPDGTRKVSVDQLEITDVDTFSYAADQSCETWCEPEQPCLPPNIPIVDGEQFACRPLDGFSDIPLPSEVDTSFGTLWRDGGGGTGTGTASGGYVERAGRVVQGTLPSVRSLTALDADRNGVAELYGASTDGTLGHQLASDGAGGLAVTATWTLDDRASAGATAGLLNADAYVDWVVWDNSRVAVSAIFAVDATRFLDPIDAGNLRVADGAVGDVDGDGFGDIVLDGETVLFGNGAGSFLTVEADGVYGGWGFPWGWGDVDADGRVDLANGQAGGTLYRQTAPRVFSATTGLQTGTLTAPVALADLDGDGFDDHVTTQWLGACPSGTCVEVAWGSANGLSGNAVPVEIPLNVGSQAAGGCDIDGDGREDVAVLIDDSVLFVTSDGDGQLTAARVSFFGGASRLDVVDIDGDGLCEAVVLSSGPTASNYWVVTP